MNQDELATISSSLITQAQVVELSTVSVVGQISDSNLPLELKAKRDSWLRQGQVLQIELAQWAQPATHYGAADLLLSDDWYNYFPAVVTEDNPCLDGTEAVEALEGDQRYLATALLKGTLTKTKREKLLARAKKLVCSLNPREPDFFTEETLNQCLSREKLTSQKQINQVLGRQNSAPIRKADKREALAVIWESRGEETSKRNYFWTESDRDELQWEVVGIEQPVIETFTYLVISTIAEQSGFGYAREEIDFAFWSVLAEARNQDEDAEMYYLDPRDDETWQGIKRLGEELGKVDGDKMHYEKQDRLTTTQRWFKEVGLPALYGTTNDWWAEMPDVPFERSPDPERKLDLLVTKNKTPREKVYYYRGSFLEGLEPLWRSEVRRRYEQQIREAMR